MLDARILGVDDEQANLALLERVLRRAGHTELILLDDPRKAEKAFVEHAPDLVILDLHMPHLDGFQLLERLRTRVGDESFLPFLILTADSTIEARRRALELGATDFVTKPIDTEELRLRVHRLLETRRLHLMVADERHHLAELVAEQTAELVEANRRLRDLVKAKDEFVASVAHGLRTPLTAVLGFARELAQASQSFDPGETAEVVRVIADHASEVAAIIDDLLVAARADIDAVSVLTEPIDIRDQLRFVLEGSPAELRERVRAFTSAPAATGDRLRVRQILRNLLLNAHRYGGPNIEVRSWGQASTVVVQVIDDGEAIAILDRDRLFEPYFRTVAKPGQPASIGLGLSVSRHLARLMGGDLTYSTQDQRNVFELRLRAWQAESDEGDKGGS